MRKGKYLYIDIESHNVGKEYEMSPKEFFRLGQYAWDNGEITLTEDLDEFISVIEQAPFIVGHNIIDFDLPAVYGVDSMRPMELARDRRVVDTMYMNHLILPPPGDLPPGRLMGVYSLDNLTTKYKLPGKVGSLQEMAEKYNPVGTPKGELDYGLIPVDDPLFREYAYNDIVAVRALFKYLMGKQQEVEFDGEYLWREMYVISIAARMKNNGWPIDVEMARKRIDDQAKRKEELLTKLQEEYDFPKEGKSPWASNKGKEATIALLKDHGIDPETDSSWPRTAKGAISLGGEAILNATAGTEIEEIGTSLAELKGQRSLAQQALEGLKGDGLVHYDITAFQRSGRFSITKPSLPIWTARGAGAVEKEYFITKPGCKIVAMDFSNADQRIVAAESGDVNYARRFEPGEDGHEINGRLMFGDEVYDSDPGTYREIAKALSHAYAYGAGAKTLARTAKLPESDDPEKTPLALAQRFVDVMKLNFPETTQWRNRVANEGEQGFVVNSWGRRMPIDTRVKNKETGEWYSRSYTQSSAMYGQSGTREIMQDGLIRIANDRMDVLYWLLATVHDELIWCIPEKELEWAVPYIIDKIETDYDPGHPGQKIHFPLSAGEPTTNWYLASH